MELRTVAKWVILVVCAIQPTRRNRLAVALLVGLVYGGLMGRALHAAGPLALGYDFTLHYWAGHAMRQGLSPYLLINAVSKAYPFCSGYLYWLPTAAILTPLTFLRLQPATALFAGLSSAVFAYALTVNGWWRLPFLGSLPFFYGALGGTVTPLVVAAMLLPTLGWLAPMKYTMAAAGFAYNLSKRYVVLAAAVTLVSIAVWPWWPVQWFHELHDVAGMYYHVPLLVPFGAAGLLALLRWRDPAARLLAVMLCVPQTMLYYDQLPLLLVARARREALAMSLASWLAPLVLVLTHGVTETDREQLFTWMAPIIVWCYYLPCVAIVLLRPGAATVPHANTGLPVVRPPPLAPEPIGGSTGTNGK